LRGSVFCMGFFEASVKVGLFSLRQVVAVGTICLSKGSTSSSEEVCSFCFGKTFVGVGVAKVVMVDLMDILLTL
jgi:hypothetical protein